MSSSATASTLTRPRIAVAVVSAFAVASAGYYLYQEYRLAQSGSEVVPGPGLHRSNAVRRNRRQTSRQDDSSDVDAEVEADENADINALAILQDSDGLQDDDSTRQRTGENIVTLLFRVSEDNARRNAYVHRGCQCNGCGMVPIRGIRYRCANCADFDLCEVCESQGLHNKTHVFYKVRIPAPPFCPRQVQPAWYPGDPDFQARTLPRPLLAKWSEETGFERVELDAYWEQWTFMANTDWTDDPDGLGVAMDRKTFERCLVPSGGYRHTSPNLIHDRMFAFYDTNKDNLIGFDEFLRGVSYRKSADKLRRTFDGYDIDGDGYVNRKDFLRMFRAYYVLYKQMHRDILEGLDEHMMTTVEAQKLVNSRAPLSSLFGREGRVPPADHSRPMEGKVFRSNGEVSIHDGKATVVNNDRPDTSSREEILSGLFAPPANRSLFTESFNTSSFGQMRQLQQSGTGSRYISGIINPPTTINDLSALINGDASRLDDIIASIRDEVAGHQPPDESDHSGSEPPEADDQETVEEEHDGSSTPAEDIENAEPLSMPDASRLPTRLSTEDELREQSRAFQLNSQRVLHSKRKRVHARRQLLERWQRRQFYLDEEEGGLAPQGWNDEEDVLVDRLAESSKSPQTTSATRSRSSSKVRFAEDTDDYDVKSNHSNYGSIPERWGGGEIPNAERDAGKEILYQVTQQAFNELLDDIFKKKEDFAVQCAQTKKIRDKYRHLFEHIQLDQGTTTPPSQENHRPVSRPIRGQNLDELLSNSGYTISPHPNDAEETTEPSQPAQIRDEEPSQRNEDVEVPENDPDLNFEDLPENLLDIAKVVVDDYPEHRDPTMPQFRPDTDPTRTVADSVGSPQQALINENALGTSSQDLYFATLSRHAKAVQKEDYASRDQGPATESVDENTITSKMLEEWKRLDLAEEEAKERGGWGKLDYPEFEQIYKEHEFQDGSRNRLDYLGSWIDFCIP